jgi:subtilisin family serine protease
MDYTHADLAPNVGAVRGWDFVGGDNAPLEEDPPGSRGDDADGHGTHVAGTIGAQGDNRVGVTGVSWDVSLMALRAADVDGQLTDDRIVAAFAYARANGARVVNGSFGGPGFSRAVLDAVNAAPNVLFIFASGNGGPDGIGDDNDVTPDYPCAYAAQNIICVAATGFADGLADFSNYGVTTVDLAAPGVGIASTLPNNGYGSGDGTSMATPHVSGVAALVFAAYPALSVGEVREAILAGVDKLPSLTRAVATGGRLNAARAVAFAAPQQVMPPPPPPPPPLLPPPPPPPVDRVAPQTTITRAPARRTTSRIARFRFVSSEAGSRFQCKLDRGLWRACRSPKAYRYLRRGWHTVRIRARDAAGNVDRTPAVRTWRIV